MFSQLVCWVNLENIHSLWKVIDFWFWFFLSCVCVCGVLVSCHLCEAQIRDFPVVHYFAVDGRDCLWTGCPSQRLPPLLVEWETAVKDRPHYDLMSSWAALLWINLFQWRREMEIKSWHLKSYYWDSWPLRSIARYCTMFHSILAHSSMEHLRLSTNKAKWLVEYYRVVFSIYPRMCVCLWVCVCVCVFKWSSPLLLSAPAVQFSHQGPTLPPAASHREGKK